nr:hypothetical protein [Tanacetum cinerariifolium]
MSSITVQQAKLDLELVPKEKRLNTGKCNERLNPGKIQREPTFQVVLDALALTLCYSAFLITVDVSEVYMHQFWDSVYKHDTFFRFKMDKRKRFKLNLEMFRDIFKIFPRVQGQDFDALLTDEEIVSFLRELGHTREINSLNDVVVDHMHKPWRTFAALINKSLFGKTTDFIYQIDNKAYKKKEKTYYPRFTKVIIHYFLTQDKTLSWRNKIEMHTSRDDYLINTLRFVSAKEETQIYGAILPESLTSPKMKETQAYKTYLGFATRATRPKKEQKFKKPASLKLTTALVSTKEPTGKLNRVKRLAKKKSMRDFHKIHPSGSGIVTKTAPSVTKIKPSVTSEGSGVKPGVPDMTEEESFDNSEHETDESKSGLESDHEENEEDEDDEEEVKDNQLYDDVDIMLNEPVDIDKGFVQEEGTDAAMTNKTEVPVTSSSYSSDLVAKILNFSDIPHTYAEIVSPIDVHVHHEVPIQKIPILLTVPVTPLFVKKTLLPISVIFDSSQVFSTVIPHSLPSFTPPPQKSTSTPPLTTKATNPPSTFLDFASAFQFNNRVTTLEKEVDELKNDPLHTQVTALVIDHLYARLEATIDEFINFLSASLTEPEFEVADSDMLQDQKENPGNDDEEPKEKVTSKHDWFTKPTQPQEPTDPDWNTFDEFISTPIDFSAFIMNSLKINNLTQETLLGPAFRLIKGTRSNYVELEYDFEECYKALSEKLDWENPKGDDYPFDLTKPLPLVMNGNRQMTKAAQYYLPGIKDMVSNIRSPVKVTYDKHALCERFNTTAGNLVKEILLKLNLLDHRIEGNLFEYETPLCKAFNDFNYFLKIDMNLFIFDIQGIRTYEEYELNKTLSRDLEEPWSDNGVPYQLFDHICEPYHFKNGRTKWPTCSLDINGFYNGGELPRMVRIGCMTYFQDHKWYDELVDGKLKEETLTHKAKVEGSWGDATSRFQECWWKVNTHKVAPFTRWESYGHGPYADAKTKRAYNPYLDINRIFGRNYGADNAGYTQDNQELEKEHHDPSTCRVRKFKMIKYSFDVDDEYVANKEDECFEHSETNTDTCQAYREIFCIMDKGWLVTKELYFCLLNFYAVPCCKEINDMMYSKKMYVELVQAF